jgi:hypothetical protein
MMKKNFVYLGVLLVSSLLLSGCSASGMKNVEQSGFLGDYSQMEQGGDGNAALTYIKPGADLKPYTKIMFEQVAVRLSSSSESNEIDPSMLVELTNYYQNALVEAVKDGYEVVDQPGPDVLWVRAAITDVEPSSPVSNTLSSIVPVGMVVAAGAKATTDANLGTGEAATEVEVLDSMTKERLAAAVDRRQGGKSAFRGKWVDTEQAFDYWAKRFRERLDELRGI